ncbi:hypothetical protein [Natroniella sp. ANB-PHB2]|uniref:hypothetical protein n=1 Tax=Natroniella sp. ANB-PHB2 TaxID=3384444 RepID=UPI0038D3FE6D
MKKLSIVLIVLLLSLMLIGGTVLAEEEGTAIEITDGEIEFVITPFARSSVEEDDWDGTQVTNRFLNIGEGYVDLEAKFTGQAFNGVEWKVEFDNIGWSRLAIAKEVGNVGVGIGTPSGSYDGDTYIKYNFTDEFALNFKPFEADFTVGDEFEVGRGEPGIELDYQMSEEMALSGSFWTTGYSTSDMNGVGGADDSKREIQFKGEVDYEEDDISLTVGMLLDIYREEERSGERELISVYGTDYFIAEESLILNALGEFEVADDLILEGEAKFGRGGYENESTGTEKSRTDLGLHAKLTRTLENEVKVYGAYTFERTASEVEKNYEEEITKLVNTFAAGVEKPLEDGLILISDISLTPSSIERERNGVEEESYSLFDMAITTGLRYQF